MNTSRQKATETDVPTQILQAILDLRQDTAQEMKDLRLDFQQSMRDLRTDWKEEMDILRQTIGTYTPQAVSEERFRGYQQFQATIENEFKDIKLEIKDIKDKQSTDGVERRDKSISVLQTIFISAGCILFSSVVSVVMTLALTSLQHHP